MVIANHIRSVEVPPLPGTRVGTTPVRARELSAGTVLVTASGEIDASSATDLCDKIEWYAAGYRQLILDLSDVDFFGTAGYSLLHRLHARCVRAAVDWVLVPGAEVQRLLRVCDPDGILPTAANIVSAVASLTRTSHRIAQLRRVVR
ncbi:MAG TPA: STAS domain-containing protein [Mycobacterium sp.]|uniref:STAS domain-containing protein n=1 Tax=Mycolicibacterium sp. TaxID=2320850 RepID=UPI0025EBAC90|nr:STAS domain-containing protein [Mycolicibacterium sp.]HPX38553.1 STAS domain-containing protein [Mycobacterium sp.]HQC78826.1 STAS domain-containing protein [Mycobacterium sp.]